MSNNDFQILRPKELCRLLSISIPTLYRWEANGQVPIKKLRFGAHGAVGYRRSDVEKWLEQMTVAE